MNSLIESKTKYPYIQIVLEVDDFQKNEEALADTGLSDLSIMIPKRLFDETKIKQKYATVEVETGDGVVHNWKGYIGKIKLGTKEFIGTIVVSEEGRELILGMEVLNELVSTFDGPAKKLKIYTK